MTYFQRHAYQIGAGFASLLWPFFPKRQRVAIDNILRAKITDDPKEARRIAKYSFAHLAGHIAEAMFVPKVVNTENWQEHLDVTTSATPAVIKLLLHTPDTPIILASAHHGVWEAACNILSITRPMIAITRIQNNKFVANWMRKHHFRGPVTLVNKNHGLTPAVLHKWKDDCAALTLLMDQYNHKGAMVKFMNRPARTFTTAARLAIRSGYPIVVGSFVRDAPYKYRLVGGDPIYFEKDADLNEAVQLLNDRLEAAIRGTYPEQYLWAHRRWRDD